MCVAAGSASAQPGGAEILGIEVPEIILEQPERADFAADEALDLANLVLSAVKGLTTVQEAPALVTVFTEQDIRDRQFSRVEQLYDEVPGWKRFGGFYSSFSNTLVRGQRQAVLYLEDGLSKFDPMANTTATTRAVPIELVKRVEMVTGPGGVLWGANSLLGIFNVITKDAEDVDGVEVGATLGDGIGDREVARAYAMAGKADILDGKIGAFLHGSVETYKGPGLKLPQLLFTSSVPQPNSVATYGPLVTTDQAASMIVSLDGKLRIGKLRIRFSLPFGTTHIPAGLSGNPSRETLPQDARCDGGLADLSCVDPLGTSRLNRVKAIDRYAIAEHRVRFWRDRMGLTTRVYAQQFERGFDALQVLAPTSLVRGGLALQTDATSYRYGAGLDGGLELSSTLRMLYGGEAFYEATTDTASAESIQGAGSLIKVTAPYVLRFTSLPCPSTFDGETMAIVTVEKCPMTAQFEGDRTVLGFYASTQYRASNRLLIDLGGRAQVTPDRLGLIDHPVTTTISSSLVWRLVPGWHAKLNYSQGFRPPVFNNLLANGETINVGGNPDLRVETSDAAQAEINARIFKGERRIRELSFRLDGSYTRINNLIQIEAGRYTNAAERRVSSVELLGRLYVLGGHWLELGYTWLRCVTTDKGPLRSLPEHWFNFATVFNLITNKLTATTGLKVTGAFEDPNRIVEYRDLEIDELGNNASNATVATTDLVFDLIPPAAELSVGLQYMPTPKMLVRATVHNALFAHHYYPDASSDFEPRLESLPNPSEGFRAYVSAAYRY